MKLLVISLAGIGDTRVATPEQRIDCMTSVTFEEVFRTLERIL